MKKEKYNSFTLQEIKAFESDAKIGILASVSPKGEPHLTLITSLQAKSENELIWGQFLEGLSKQQVRENPRVGFLIMTMDKGLWRGKAMWTGSKKEGVEYQMYNQKPMFRYNSYFGIHTIHYMKLIETYRKEKLPLSKIVFSTILSKISKISFTPKLSSSEGQVLKPWAQSLFERLDTLKFISYIDSDGFPVVVPLFQCQAADSKTLIFSSLAYKEELQKIPRDASVAIFVQTMEMENVLLRGKLRRSKLKRWSDTETIDINWVYNSMPPIPGQIYPQHDLRPVNFHNF